MNRIYQSPRYYGRGLYLKAENLGPEKQGQEQGHCFLSSKHGQVPEDTSLISTVGCIRKTYSCPYARQMSTNLKIILLRKFAKSHCKRSHHTSSVLLHHLVKYKQGFKQKSHSLVTANCSDNDKFILQHASLTLITVCSHTDQFFPQWSPWSDYEEKLLPTEDLTQYSLR